MAAAAAAAGLLSAARVESLTTSADMLLPPFGAHEFINQPLSPSTTDHELQTSGLCRQPETIISRPGVACSSQQLAGSS